MIIIIIIIIIIINGKQSEICYAWKNCMTVNRGQTREICKSYAKYLKVKVVFFHCFKFNILPILCQFIKRFESLLKKFLIV